MITIMLTVLSIAVILLFGALYLSVIVTGRLIRDMRTLTERVDALDEELDEIALSVQEATNEVVADIRAAIIDDDDEDAETLQ